MNANRCLVGALYSLLRGYDNRLARRLRYRYIGHVGGVLLSSQRQVGLSARTALPDHFLTNVTLPRKGNNCLLTASFAGAYIAGMEAQTFRAIRRRMDMTQQQLGARVRLSERQIRYIESGAMKPSGPLIVLMQQLAEECGM